ncbi:replicative DNA helicase [Carboxylicivirga marina]|uniref:Replicative DNA helicase n=1 Tax=Carboxylicivirga marina TaxID=2800988 RepID=A0ABS1HH37_9BACT|nr:replicative DNA helicase [Carboxylicivirga marina]MBK3516972.1 replicative DNA helicase [Carboxylicivirga marina]
MADNKYSNRKKPAATGLEMGKLPPQVTDLEEAVLGALLLEKEAFLSVSELLKPEHFYKEANQHIYKAILDLEAHEQPVDMLTVTQQLKKMTKLEECGGAFYITQLTSKVASAAHIEYHARIIWQKYLQRQMIQISSELQGKAYDDSIDVNDLLEEAESTFFMLSQGSMKRDATQINPVIQDAIDRIKEASERDDGMSGVASGFAALDKITSGWQGSALIILAARPAMGKTAFVLSMARQMALVHKTPVAIFSLEMSNLELVNRLIVTETELSADKIKKGNLAPYEWEQLDHKIQNLIDAPIFVDDTAGLSVFELRAKCRRLKKQHDIQCVIIDYLQLMNASGMNPGSRQEEVSLISRNLKGLAKELDVPIIALSQLNRGVEGRAGAEGKRPQLSDLRESGAIEQDADMVCFIHRPEYYRITEDEEGNSLIGMAELIIAKHRAGPTADVRLRFRAELARFQDVEDAEYEDNAFSQSNSPTQVLGSKMNENEGADGSVPAGGQQLPEFPEGPGFNSDVPF